MNKLNIKYYFKTDIKNSNSILKRVQTFFDKFIKDLNEKSVIYQNLLYIDGGSGYYKEEKVYTYDMTNLVMIKAHHKEIIPQILIFCYMENNEVSFTALFLFMEISMKNFQI